MKTNTSKKIKRDYNKKASELTSEALLLITKIANKVEREISTSFKVLDIEKISIRDIESSEVMYYQAPLIDPPKFNENTSLELQKLVIDAYLFQKENNGFLYTTMVSIDDLWPVICQRTLSVPRVNKIAKEFSTYKFTPIELIYLDDTLHLGIKNGHHHAAAAKTLNIPKVPCTIAFGQTIEEVSADFESQHDCCKMLSQAERYEAGLDAGYQDCIIINKVCNLFRIKLAGNINEYPKTVRSIRAVKRIVRDYGEDGLKFVFQMLIDAGWEKQTKAYEESALNIGYGLLEIIKDNKGDFNYDSFLKEVHNYQTVTDYLTHMNEVIGSFAVPKHPEKTPKMYLEQKYGK